MSNGLKEGAATQLFCCFLADVSTVTWGYPDHGGDSSEVQDQLKGVKRLQANKSALVGILVDGSVVTWGQSDYGGDSSRVQDQLKSVQQVQAAQSAFAAILADGSVVTWGKPDSGGDCLAVSDQFAYVCICAVSLAQSHLAVQNPTRFCLAYV